jgi:hypothetical protein
MISLWIYLFVIISAVAKAAMDKINFHFNDSIFVSLKREFWDSKYSWQNKWKQGFSELGEKFFFSSTILVFLTDGWHLMQFIFLNSLFIAFFLISLHYFSYYEAIIHLILLRALFGVTFELFFKYIFSNKV